MPMPTYLYHATPKVRAETIAKEGLQPHSVGGKASSPYLCMAGKEGEAITLKNQASDIIFRVKGSDLQESHWAKIGANSEWRSTDSIPANKLEYRRNLGTPAQKTWRAAATYPLGT